MGRINRDGTHKSPWDA